MMKALIIFYGWLLFSMLLSCSEKALDPDTENYLNVIWTSPIYLINGPTQPSIIDESSLIVSGDYNLTSINIEDGSINWASEIDGTSGLRNRELLFEQERKLIISNHFKKIFVWNSETGEIIYDLDENDGILAHNLGYNTYTESGYAIIGDTLDLYMMNWDGGILFQLDIPWRSRSVVSGVNNLYMGFNETVHGGLTLGKIISLNTISGDSLWSYTTNNGGFNYASIIYEDNYIYGGTIGNSPTSELVALNANTGDIIWKQTDYVWARNLAIGPSKIYVNTGGSLAAFDKLNGTFKWRVEWLGTDYFKPTYLEGYVYHTRTSELLIINDSTGEVVHREPVPEGNGYFWNVTAGDDKIFIQTNVAVIAYQPWHLREE